MTNKSAVPALIVSILLIISSGIISLSYLLSNEPLVFLNTMNSYGLDYQDFFKASESILNGQSPYALPNNRYVTTPIPAIAGLILVPLGFDNARVLLYVLIPLSLALGYWLITLLYGFSARIRNQVLLTGLVCLLFGYPFYFLEQRENIDGWVFFFLCLGIFFSQKRNMEFLSSLLLALAIVFKLYPVLILLPLLLYRKWRLLLWAGVWLALLAVPTIFWYSDFHAAMVERSQILFRVDENGSLIATLNLITLFIGKLGVPINGLTSLIKFGPLIYSGLLSAVVFCDFKLSRERGFEITDAIMYLPFMIAIPRVVYHYSFVLCLILIPAACYLWLKTDNRWQKATIIFIAIGISLSQVQAIAIYNLTQNVLTQIIPGLGLLVIMLGITIYKAISVFRPSVPAAIGTDGRKMPSLEPGEEFNVPPVLPALSPIHPKIVK